AWGAYHHIMDPNTLRSAEGIRAVWVAADEARIADGLTTALFFVPPYELEFGYTFEYLIVRDDYSLAVSDGFPAELFT
ncbi:FAD:protein FMN transferase, partial [Klebsiella pneumoniae]|uniref:FAD:protein FMN transferase n=1 Tax=Klebsiella pneumoniae TaxID=573 RepID=UPI003EE14E90